MSVVSIVRCGNYAQKKVDQTVRKSFELIGGIDKIVKKGDRVFLKINLTAARAPEAAVTTHPSVVRAVGEMVREAGAKVWIGDSSEREQIVWLNLRRAIRKKMAGKTYEQTSKLFTKLHAGSGVKDILALKLDGKNKPVFTARDLGIKGIYEKIYHKTGIDKIAKDIGAKLIPFDEEKWIEIDNPNGTFLKKIWTIKPVIEADVIIGISKLKTHDVAFPLTGAIKNFLGIAPGRHKSKYHRNANSTGQMAEMLTDILAFVKPKLSVMDAIVGMQGNGPINGQPRKIGVIITSRDTVAVDVVASSLVNVDPSKVKTIKVAAKRMLGAGTIKKIQVVGEPVEKVKIKDFKLPIKRGW